MAVNNEHHNIVLPITLDSKLELNVNLRQKYIKDVSKHLAYIQFRHSNKGKFSKEYAQKIVQNMYPTIATSYDMSQLMLQPHETCVIDQNDLYDISCPICCCVFTRPVSTTCNHVFCYTCLAAWVQKSDKCPQCISSLLRPRGGGIPIDEAVVVSTRITETIIRCPSDTCDWLGRVVDYNKHVRECIHYISNYDNVPVICAACQQSSTIGSYEHHIVQCSSRPDRCTDCNNFYSHAELLIHQKSCPMKRITCKWCKAEHSVSMSISHLKICKSKFGLCNDCGRQKCKNHVCKHKKCPGCSETYSTASFTRHVMFCDTSRVSKISKNTKNAKYVAV